MADDKKEIIETKEKIIAEKGNYTLTWKKWFNGNFLYTVYDQFNDIIKRWSSMTDISNIVNKAELEDSVPYRIFLGCMKKRVSYNQPTQTQTGFNYPSSWGKSFSPEQQAKWEAERKEREAKLHAEQEKLLSDLNKSNTLCIHKDDPTTTMLRQIYEGKGWDVINDTYAVEHDTLHKLIDSHERIVMLGHGTSWGLIGSIRDCCAEHLKGKKLFCLWCNADGYCKHHPELGTGFFACGNMPSDDGEARAVGYHVSHQYMDDNITYWCKLCGDVVEQCLEGDAKAGCKYIRDKYWEKYGHSDNPDEIGITCYNYQRTKTAGEDLIPEPEGYVPAPKKEYQYTPYQAYEKPNNGTTNNPYYKETKKDSTKSKVAYDNEEFDDYDDPFGWWK